MHLSALIKVPSGRFVLSHRCWPWIFTACLTGDNNDCLRPSSCQTSVLRDFACLTQVTLIFGSSVASLRQGICCTHGDHMAFAAAHEQNFPNQSAAHSRWHFSSGRIFCVDSLRANGPEFIGRKILLGRLLFLLDTHIYPSFRKKELTIVTKLLLSIIYWSFPKVHSIVSSFYHFRSNHNEKGLERQLNTSVLIFNVMNLGKKKSDSKCVNRF